jgi:hypothetical protein
MSYKARKAVSDISAQLEICKKEFLCITHEETSPQKRHILTGTYLINSFVKKIGARKIKKMKGNFSAWRSLSRTELALVRDKLARTAGSGLASKNFFFSNSFDFCLPGGNLFSKLQPSNYCTKNINAFT